MYCPYPVSYYYYYLSTMVCTLYSMYVCTPHAHILVLVLVHPQSDGM